jgi:SAM-dependent methyltransferase
MAAGTKDKKPGGKPETSPSVLREGVVRRAERHIAATGRLSFKCIPSLVDQYLSVLETQFKILGRPYAAPELEQLKANLKLKLDEGWKASQYSRVVVEYKTDTPPKDGLSYVITARVFTLPELYQEWVDTRKPPLFGAHPDAKVMDLAASLGSPGDVPVLDIGAGTGRNALPLAKAGHPTTVVEFAPSLLGIMRKDMEESKIEVAILEGDVLDEAVVLPPNAFRLVILCEVVTHFNEVHHLRRLMSRVVETLQPGGLVLFSAFLSHDAYTPDKLCREASRAFWASVFSRKDLELAAEGLPLERLSDESAYDYEKEHLPADGWPPTGWYPSWALGHDVYKLQGLKAPIELRWITMRRT